MCATDRLCQIESSPRLLVELSADHHEVGIFGPHAAKKIGGRNS